jgi:transcriptional regulator/post-segregation antitoxin (ccd killing protein)
MARVTTRPAALIYAEKSSKAVELRRQGKNYKEIGQALGVTEQKAWQIVKKEMQRLLKFRTEAADALVRLELDRLDMLLAVVWPKAEKGDTKAVDSALKIAERRSKLLGLDAPTKVKGELTFKTYTDDELMAEARRLGLEVPAGLLTGDDTMEAEIVEVRNDNQDRHREGPGEGKSIR